MTLQFYTVLYAITPVKWCWGFRRRCRLHLLDFDGHLAVGLGLFLGLHCNFGRSLLGFRCLKRGLSFNRTFCRGRFWFDVGYLEPIGGGFSGCGSLNWLDRAVGRSRFGVERRQTLQTFGGKLTGFLQSRFVLCLTIADWFIQVRPLTQFFSVSFLQWRITNNFRELSPK